jgi:ubiquinone/menaquinone biosynthesis C-methylase UbiE
MVDIDLDQLADAYRLRPMSTAARARAELSSDGCQGLLLDIGGGTGDHAAAWVGAKRFPVVVDPASAMLTRASRHGGVAVVRATAQALPFQDHVAALAYFHLSIHYGDWRRSIAEALRVTRPGGRIEVWTMDREAIARSSLGRWFPKVVEIDQERFPDPADLARQLASNGRSVAISSTSETVDRSAADWADAVRARFVSTLQLLDDAEIAEGLAGFDAAHPDPDGRYRYELVLKRISTTV